MAQQIIKASITIFIICLFTTQCLSQNDQSVAAFMRTAKEVSTMPSLTQDDVIKLLLHGSAIDSAASRPYQTKEEELTFRKLNLLIQEAKHADWFDNFFGALTIQETRRFVLLEGLGAKSREDFEAQSLPRKAAVELIYDIGMTHGMANELLTDKNKAVHYYVPMMNLGLVARFHPRSNIQKASINTLSWGIGTGANMAQQDTVRTTYIPAKLLIFGELQNANTFQFEVDYFFNATGGKNMFGYGFLIGSNSIKVGTLFYYKKNFNMISVEVRYNLAFAFRRYRY